MSGCAGRRWAQTRSTCSQSLEVALSVLLLGDRWPLKPAVIATYWSGICDQYCLYRENFKYKLHRISVGEDKSPVWWRSPSASPGVTMEYGEGTGDSPARATSSISAKTRLPPSSPCVLNWFNPKITPTAWPWVSWDVAGPPQQLPPKTPKFLFPGHQGQLVFHANPAWVLPIGNIPFWFRSWTVGMK